MEPGWWRDPAHVRKVALGEASLRARAERRTKRRLIAAWACYAFAVVIFATGGLARLSRRELEPVERAPEHMTAAEVERRTSPPTVDFWDHSAVKPVVAPRVETFGRPVVIGSCAACSRCGATFDPSYCFSISLEGVGQAYFRGCARCVAAEVAGTSSR